mgnify:FL=1
MLKNHSQYDISTWTLSVFFAVSAIFALLVITTRFRNPKPSGLPSNLLFFASFATLTQYEYVDTMKAALQDNEQARSLIMRDIYQIGKVLDKKCASLRLSYLAIGAGIVISIISFSVQHFGSF